MTTDEVLSEFRAAGALLGVGAMSVLGGQKTIVLCLCEGELVVLHGVL